MGFILLKLCFIYIPKLHNFLSCFALIHIELSNVEIAHQFIHRIFKSFCEGFFQGFI